MYQIITHTQTWPVIYNKPLSALMYRYTYSMLLKFIFYWLLWVITYYVSSGLLLTPTGQPSGPCFHDSPNPWWLLLLHSFLFPLWSSSNPQSRNLKPCLCLFSPVSLLPSSWLGCEAQWRRDFACPLFTVACAPLSRVHQGYWTRQPLRSIEIAGRWAKWADMTSPEGSLQDLLPGEPKK